MTSKPKMGGFPTAALHVVGTSHDFIEVFDREVSVVKSKLAIHARQGCSGIEEQNGVVIIAAVRAQVIAKSHLLIGQLETEALTHESCATFKLRHCKYHMSDPLGMSTLSPAPVLIESYRTPWRVTVLRCGENLPSLEYTQPHGKAEVGQEVHRSVLVAAHIAVTGKAGRQFLECTLIVHSPYHLAYTGPPD